MYSHLYVGRILREGGTQPRKAKDSMVSSDPFQPKGSHTKPSVSPLTLKLHKPIFQELKVPQQDVLRQRTKTSF